MRDKKAQPRLCGGQWIDSQQFADRRDLLRAVLKPEETYTAGDVRRMLGAFIKRRMK